MENNETPWDVLSRVYALRYHLDEIEKLSPGFLDPKYWKSANKQFVRALAKDMLRYANENP
jgi:hypothetical protein